MYSFAQLTCICKLRTERSLGVNVVCGGISLPRFKSSTRHWYLHFFLDLLQDLTVTIILVVTFQFYNLLAYSSKIVVGLHALLEK